MRHKGLRKPTQGLVGILAENVRALRLADGLSQEELADICCLHRTYIGSVERGERNVTLSTLEVLAAALGVTIASLLTPLRKSDDRTAKRPERRRKS
ncbi:MAG: helix-turn-helix domain-containing protein [Gammaproteobacteria bacterium]